MMTETETGYSSASSPHKGHRGLSRAWQSGKNSGSGLMFAVREESVFRQTLTLTACVTPLAFLLPCDAVEPLVLIGSVVLVAIVELLNSGIEAANDRISFEHHIRSKHAKDYSSAAVMLALLTCSMVWITLTYRLFAG